VEPRCPKCDRQCPNDHIHHRIHTNSNMNPLIKHCCPACFVSKRSFHPSEDSAFFPAINSGHFSSHLRNRDKPSDSSNYQLKQCRCSSFSKWCEFINEHHHLHSHR